jgi:hypothetical protein
MTAGGYIEVRKHNDGDPVIHEAKHHGTRVTRMTYESMDSGIAHKPSEAILEAVDQNRLAALQRRRRPHLSQGGFLHECFVGKRGIPLDQVVDRAPPP